jgi:hypothetical protein
MKVALINDTSDNGHFGCRLVRQAYDELLAARGAELIGTQYRKEPIDLGLLEAADLVIVNGEGCTHHNNYTWLYDIPGFSDTPAVLLNCVWEANDDFGQALSNFKTVTVRESLSAADMLETSGIVAEVVPDVIFSMNSRYRQPRTEPMVTDSSNRSYKGWTHKAKDPDFLRRLSRSSSVVSGRYHAVCLAAMLEIPFSAYNGNTHKIKGIMKDMGLSHLYAEKAEHAIRLCPEEVQEKATEYARDAKDKVNDLFDRILA